MHPSSVPHPPPQLLIVMPVYNEQASVRKVVLEWFQEITQWTGDFVFLAIDDGSTDASATVLGELREQLGPRLEILQRENRGHGQSCLQGYRLARERGVPFVLQIDSDGQCDPRYFSQFWHRRMDYDVIYGRRTHRDDGWARTFASGVVRAFLFTLFWVNCVDANVPYRLMRPAALGPVLARIPADFLLANVALAVLLRHERGVRQGSVPIRFRDRYGGTPSVRLGGFATRAVQLYRQLRAMLAQRLPADQNGLQ